jgi:hypothetical protein
MPVWYCGYCSHWHPRQRPFCMYCGRSPEGRVCRQCKTKAPNEARFCPACGSDRLTEPAEPGIHLSRRVRWLLAGAGGLTFWVLAAVLKRWGQPVATTIIAGVFRVVEQTAAALFVFWLVTGLLPLGWGSKVRAATWAVVRFVTGFCIRLVR